METNQQPVKHHCQCENHAHFDPNKTTPMGKKAHGYGRATKIVTPVKTVYGTFQVCTDCLNDCQKGI